MSQPTITFENVEVVSSSDLAMQVRVQGKAVVIGSLQSLPGTTIHRLGQRGRLVLSLWTARELGLSGPASASAA
jgi:hypothetical protein